MAIARALCANYGEVVLKLGHADALWIRAGGDPIVVPADRVDAIDTTGAGDAFCAGFLSVWSGHQSAREALVVAVAQGAVAASRIGAHPLGPRA